MTPIRFARRMTPIRFTRPTTPIRFTRPGTPATWAAGAALVVVASTMITLAAQGGAPAGFVRRVTPAGAVPPGAAPSDPLAPALPTGPVREAPANCPTPTVTVADAKALHDALATAQPGASIRLMDGVYEGKFVATVAGTTETPIQLCGGPGAILDGGGIKEGYALHLNGASHWRVTGLSIRNSQKGLMADRVQGVVIQGLTVEQIGDEAIHLRNFSSDNVVEGNTVRDTGKRKETYGEGIYIGTAESNWCTITDCKPDNSDRNIVRGNTITATTSESIDIKEGTTGGLIAGNTFDGADFSGSHADSWIDVKGNNWVIEGNVGRNSRQDGFQTHEVVNGWGTNNVFKGNTAEVNGPGYGFNFKPVRNNRATCDNKVIGAAQGFGNAPCS